MSLFQEQHKMCPKQELVSLILCRIRWGSQFPLSRVHTVFDLVFVRWLSFDRIHQLLPYQILSPEMLPLLNKLHSHVSSDIGWCNFIANLLFDVSSAHRRSTWPSFQYRQVFPLSKDYSKHSSYIYSVLLWLEKPIQNVSAQQDVLFM